VRARAQERSVSILSLSLFAVLVGAVSGLGAVVFRGLIALFHNLLFLGKLSFFYDANAHTPASPWGPFVILVPVAGALAVAWLVKNFAPEAKGHGVPEVMDAIYYNQGFIRPVVAVIKSLASAISIGSGGSVGREGPIVQIGSTFGSAMGQLPRMATWQRITLIGAGAGGGIAATFNTPIGGVLFALELMLHEVSARTIIPVILSTVTATYVGRAVFGDRPSFFIPSLEISYFQLSSPFALVGYAVLGVVLGVACAGYIRSIYGAEDFFDARVRGSYYRRHAIGMLLVGVIIYVLRSMFGHYYVEGVGYATIQDILSGARLPVYLLLVLFALKLVATSLTLGSGASGGIFSPSLYLGATLGGAYGILFQSLLPALSVSPEAFAVAGMAGVVAGATGAAVTAVVMVFEMTLDYRVILPMTITAAVSYGIRRALQKESIYTLKLARRGHRVPEALQANPHLARPAEEVMSRSFAVVSASESAAEVLPRMLGRSEVSVFVVADDNRIAGILSGPSLREAAGKLDKAATIGEIADQSYLCVSGETSLINILAKLRLRQASIALVVRDGTACTVDQLQGVITVQEMADSLVSATELFAD